MSLAGLANFERLFDRGAALLVGLGVLLGVAMAGVSL